MSGPESADYAAPYPGILTVSAAQYGQEIVLQYANTPPSRLDVARMIELLRRTADDLAAGFPIGEQP